MLKFKTELKKCNEFSGTLIPKGSEVPIDEPTLFIYCQFKTQNLLLRALNFLTAGLFKLNHKVLVGTSITLNICLVNISKSKNKRISGGSTEFRIRYPNLGAPRRWFINIPVIETEKDCYSKEEKDFFVPEVPGTHHLIIKPLQGIRYAGPYGLGGRKYKIVGERQSLRAAFHVSSIEEYRTLTIAFIALMVSSITLIVTLLQILFSVFSGAGQ
jgi:hypothetical protein